MDFTASSVTSHINKLEFPITGLGFFMGVTEKAHKYHAERNENYGWAWRTADFLGNLGIGGVDIYGYKSKGNLQLKPMGWLNYGLALVIVGWVLGKIGGALGGIAEAILVPFGSGMMVGGIFDPIPGTETPRSLGSNTTNPFMGMYR